MSGWVIAAGQQLRHRRWQDEVVVYNDLSGDTHLLSADAWTLLEQLNSAGAPLAAPALAVHLGLGPEYGADCAELDALLASLQQLALVAYTAPAPAAALAPAASAAPTP